MRFHARQRRRVRNRIGIATISVVVVAFATLPSAQADPTRPPDSSAAEKLAAEPQGRTDPPGEYGSDTYYSSAAEEANLRAVGELAESVDAVGSDRTGVDSMLVRVPVGSKVPQDKVVGTFTVHFEDSRFTAASLDSLQSQVSTAGNNAAAAGERFSFGSTYDAQQDLLVVSGTVPPSVMALAKLRSADGLSVEAGAPPSPEDGRQ